MNTTTTRNRFSNRDRLGRFCRIVHVDEARTDGTFLLDAADVSHAHGRCGNITGTTTPEGSTPAGWICTACVSVPPRAATLGAEVPCITGTSVCECCDRVLPVRRFPTVSLGGRFVRDHRVCRSCKKAGWTPRADLFGTVPAVAGWVDRPLVVAA